VLAGHEPIHQFGTVIKSRLADWEIARETFYIPEQIQQADAVILVAGFEGTFRAANWARIAGKPLLPFTAFGGAAEKIYAQELNEFNEKYAGLVEPIEYEQLNSLKPDWAAHATDLLALAEKVAESRRALVIMSYETRPELDDVYDSIRTVVEGMSYHCDRVTEETAGDRILPDILEGIRRAAFTVVDLTDLRPNVFYELGYADGLGKRVIVTAKQGTELPFDVKDIPTIFWCGQTQLKKELGKRIQTVVKSAIPAADPPIGPR
jgi:nucleoside 2-deoxyribosyltransferase